jgi:hypothetical protein
MTDHPGFDPYAVLGIGPDADVVVIQLAYKARIRGAHPDIAGAAGLQQTKRLNAARDWLLDPALRAQLDGPASRSRPSGAPKDGYRHPGRDARTDRRRAHQAAAHTSVDPTAFDFGPRTDQLRAFLRSIAGLSGDERARVNYSLGDTRPLHFDDYLDYFDRRLWSRSQALRAAVSSAWNAGIDEEAPFVPPLGQLVPSGFLVANAWAQWVLLERFFRHELGDAMFRSDQVFDSFAARCMGPWQASVRQLRYGPHGLAVRGFLHSASTLSVDAAQRLARSWHRHLGSDGPGRPDGNAGPGVWLPAPPDVPEVLRVSGYLAAVDASRIEPPPGLDTALHGGFRYGLRLAAHLTALGPLGSWSYQYMRPWRDAVGVDRSAWGRLRSLVSAS